LDASPLYHKIEAVMNGRPFKRKIGFQSVDFNSGHIVIFDETIPQELQAKAVCSSASIPPVF
jgi:predicted acylesterase/phospholipase RssA